MTIAELNDLARTTMGVTCKLFQTEGINALDPHDQSRIREKVETYGTAQAGDLRHFFTPDNDPYGEHDFGVVYHNDLKIFWKIDYYDKSLQFGSDEPANPAKTTRVLTIMLAEEY